METARAKMTALQRKQRETERVANLAGQNDKKFVDFIYLFICFLRQKCLIRIVSISVKNSFKAPMTK